MWSVTMENPPSSEHLQLPPRHFKSGVEPSISSIELKLGIIWYVFIYLHVLIIVNKIKLNLDHEIELLTFNFSF